MEQIISDLDDVEIYIDDVGYFSMNFSKNILLYMHLFDLINVIILS